MSDNAWVRCIEHDIELAAARYTPEQDHETVGHVAGVAALHRHHWPDHTLEFGREDARESAVWHDLEALQDEERGAKQRAMLSEMERLKREKLEKRAAWPTPT